MTATTTRDELRRQHTDLLVRLERAREIASRAPHELHNALLDLDNVLRWHQLAEEDALSDLLPHANEWELFCAIREHAEEHKRIHETLREVTTGDPKDAVEKAVALFDRILAHIRAETFVASG